ncbi:MAG: choice-of-anchor E domain-containing protein [Chromatiales bacterium]|jgi:hypothetical protein|nr:choice-of-anchor E domain-containing protein [Chromatiales bacterium]
MSNKLRSAVALAAATLAASGGAHAVVISSSFTNGLQPLKINQTRSLAKFNSALGTLNSATLTLSGSALGQFGIFNSGPVPATLLAGANIKLDWATGLAGLDLSAKDLQLSLSVILPVGPYASQQTSDTASASLSFSGNPLLFLGGAGDLFQLQCESSASAFVRVDGGEGGGSKVGVAVSAGCGGRIDYDYTPATAVPEPGAIALLGVGLLGAGAGVRRARSVSDGRAAARRRRQ